MSFADLLQQAQARDDYWVEDAIISFTEQLYELMKDGGVSQSELAAKIGASQPYVAKILRGRDNFTIATMVKLVRALGASLKLFVHRDADSATETGIEEIAIPGPWAARSLKVAAHSASGHGVELVH